MIRKNKFALAMLGMMVMPYASAQAQDFKPYFGLGLGAVGLEETAPGFSQKSTVFGGFARGGVDFNNYIGVELRGGTSMKGTKDYPGGALGTAIPTNVDLKSEYFFSYLVKLQVPLGESFKIYGLGGGTTAKFNTTVTTPSTGTSTSTKAVKIGASYGGGLDYVVDDQSSIGAEWMQYWTNVTVGANTKAKIWSGTLTWTRHF